MTISRSSISQQIKKPAVKKPPKGYHYMPNGKLMKNSAMKNRKIKKK